MDPNAVKEDNRSGQTTARGEPLSGFNMLDDAQALWLELRGLSHDRLRLAALETQRAGTSLVAMIIEGVMIAVLLNAAWLGLLAAAVQWLVENGTVASSSAILFAVAFNLLLVLILCGLIRRKSRYLRFPATLHSLQPTPTERQDSENA